MPILNYTTQIAAQKSANEISQRLGKHGATRVSVLYEGGEPMGVSFAIDTPFGERDFTLPANVDGVLAALKAQKVQQRYLNKAQAQRTAWRILKDWIEAQLAIIEAGMVRLDEVMMPYMLIDGGRSFYTVYQNSIEMRTAIGH